jgi:hypothetical protein
VKPDARTERQFRRRGVAVLIVLALSAARGPRPACAAKVEAWRQDSASAFAKGHKERVVVSDAGRIRLARGIRPTAEMEAAHVWALVRTKAGAVFAATGNEGKVFRREGAGPWSVAYDADDTQVLSLASLPDGRVFAGTGPGGRVVEVTDPKQPSSRPGKDVQYVWGLAADGDGNLYAATGPSGQLWKRPADGQWSLVLDSPHPHLLCVAAGPDGAAYAGSDGEGLIYRVDKAGKVSVLYDAPQSEVRTLLVAADGSLFAGTAAESGGGASGGGAVRGLSLSDAGPAPAGAGRRAAASGAAAPPQAKERARPTEPPGGTATPRPVSPGDNAVYHIGPDGAAREVFRARALIFAMALQGGRLLIGTGPEGQLFEVRGLGRESAPIARLDHGQILSLLADPGGELWIGTGDPGGVRRLAAGHVASGTLTSDVLDAKLVSRFGAVSWRGDRPAGTTISLQVRTGNVGEPDATWSDWSKPQSDPDSARALVPPGRFAQYRVTLATDDPAATPEVRSVALHYQTSNLPPEIAKVTVPDLTEADGATRQTRLTLRWDASDPNGDDLEYTLHIRKEGWPDWIKLGEEPLAGKSYEWDTTAVPAGTYRVRVTANDRPSNPPGDALECDLTSEPFVVDHQAPAVTVAMKGTVAAVALKDDLTRLVKASYALDGGEWVPIFADDGLFDTPSEAITIRLGDLKPGTHVLMVRATDAAGNVGAGDTVFKVP